MDSAVKLNEYKCHKIVHAAKITEIESHESDGTGSHTMIFGEIQGKQFLTDEWKEKHNPEVGGYFVVYEDGYTSYSPGPAFESGYSVLIDEPETKEEVHTENLNFSEALNFLKGNEKLARKGWNGKGMFIYLAVPDDDPSEIYTSLPYLMMKTVDNGLVPWLASQTDILATDWEVLFY